MDEGKTALTFLRPTLAYIAASFAGSATIMILIFAFFLRLMLEQFPNAQPVPVFVLGTIFWGFAIAILALPAFVGAVFLMRALRLPRGWADAIVGALIAATLIWLIAAGGARGLEESGRILLSIAPVAGCVSGLTYWAVAGRPGRVDHDA